MDLFTNTIRHCEREKLRELISPAAALRLLIPAWAPFTAFFQLQVNGAGGALRALFVPRIRPDPRAHLQVHRLLFGSNGW